MKYILEHPVKGTIGTSYMNMATWNINPYFTYILGAQYFDTGAYINDIITQPKDGFFVASLLAFKFLGPIIQLKGNSLTPLKYIL